jgi:hypothetical protein
MNKFHGFSSDNKIDDERVTQLAGGLLKLQILYNLNLDFK